MFLRKSLVDTFAVLSSVPTLAQTLELLNPPIRFADSLFCAAQFPVNCDSTRQCKNDSDCPLGQHCLIESECATGVLDPTPAQQSNPAQVFAPAQQPTLIHQSAPVPMAQNTPTSVNPTCNICEPNQMGVNAAVNFNGRPTNCAAAYNFMAKNYNAGTKNCISAQVALSSTCCQGQGNISTNSQATQSSLLIPSTTGDQSSSSSSPYAGSQPVAQIPAEPITSACNVCRPNQIGVNAVVNFNGQRTNCATVYDYMSRNFKEGSEKCIDVQNTLSDTCCQEQEIASTSQPILSYPTSNIQPRPSTSVNQPTYSNVEEKPTAPVQTTPIQPTYSNVEERPAAQVQITPITENIQSNTPVQEADIIQILASASKPETPYPSNSYYCGSSFDSAANSCALPCPSSQDSECPGDLTCFGNTECMHRESYYCGLSWLDASDTCSKPCPSGDALECDKGDGCFAWTSCENTESFYCGVSFEDASSNCALACPSRSSLDCPDGQSCFAYTTCEGKDASIHETSPAHVPLNDKFCGISKEVASSTCSIACQSGQDNECPSGMQCYDGTGCSSRDTFWCGSDWMNAAEMCTRPCSSGSSDECGAGESCYAHTGCQTNLFFCGDTFEEASESCGRPCESRSSDECSGDQFCFAFVTACASEASPFSPTHEPTKQSYSFSVANNEWNVDFSTTKDNESENTLSNDNQEGKQHWYTQWTGKSESNSSSSSTKTVSLVLMISICSLLTVIF